MTREFRISHLRAPRATASTYALLVAFGLVLALAIAVGLAPAPDTDAMAGHAWQWLQLTPAGLTARVH